MMNGTNSKLKTAILTTPAGGFVAHYLVKNLNVVGIVIDQGKFGARGRKKSLWERVSAEKVKAGYKGILVAVVNRLSASVLKRDLFADDDVRAAKVQREYVGKLDDIVFGYPYYQKRLEYRDFVEWDDLADYYNVPIIYVEDINGESSAKALREWDVDLGIIVGGRIIKSNIIQIPKLGILNKHSSILPKHRGLASEYWCLYYEDFDSLGITVHYVEPGLDNGPVVVQKKMLFEKGDTPVSLRFKSNIIGREAIVEAVREIEATGTRGARQNEALASRNEEPTLQSDKVLYSKLPILWEKYGAG